MNKTGNKHSNLLDKLIEASKQEQDSTSEIVKSVSKAMKQTPQPTMKEIISQVVKSTGKTKISKTAQFDTPMDAPPGMPDDEPMPEGGDTNEPADVEGAKSALCEALLALCGDIESVHACIDQNCGGQETGEEMPELESETEPMSGPGMGGGMGGGMGRGM